MMDKLLDKYYAGETSREEEARLAELLSRNTDPRYEADRRLICALHGPMPDFGEMARSASRRREFMPLRWVSVAASVAVVLIAASSLLRQPARTMETEMTVADATEQTRLALMMFSDAFDRGFQELDKLNDL